MDVPSAPRRPISPGVTRPSSPRSPLALRSIRRAVPVALVAALLLGAGGGCATLLALGRQVLAPEVSFKEAALVRAPSRLQLQAYFCPRLLRREGRMGIAADALCMQLFGQVPPSSALEIAFDLRMRVKNPNEIPLPLSSILTAVTVFPDTGGQQVGATCLRVCPPEDPGCAARVAETDAACREAPGDLRSLEDFPTALANLLRPEGLGAGGGPPGLTAPQLAAGAEVPVVARLAFTPDVLLPVVAELVRQSVGELERGQALSLAIPYRLEGTVFADAGSMGRVAAGFGPTSGTFEMPREALRLTGP
jgi:hypothetical protein